MHRIELEALTRHQFYMYLIFLIGVSSNQTHLDAFVITDEDLGGLPDKNWTIFQVN